jgi:acyl-CoA dehydrogenase
MTAKEIIMSLPSRLKKGAGGGVDIFFHFIISGDGGGNFTVKLKDGVCTATEGLEGSDPKCVVETSDKTYVEVETGKTNPQMAVLFDKVKVSNVASMIKFAEMFEGYSPT